MQERKIKLLLIFSGACAGILIGAAAVYFTVPKNNVDESFIDKIVNRISTILPKSEREPEQRSGPSDSAPTAQRKHQGGSKNTDADAETNSQEGIASDTLQAAKTDSLTVTGISEEVVVTDMQVGTTEIAIQFLGNNKNSAADSVLLQLNGIKGDIKSKNGPRSLKLEFWKSPVNYRGYKLNGSTLVVFGLDPDQPCKAMVIDQTLVLKHAENYYRIGSENDFRPLDKISLAELVQKNLK